MTLTTLTNPQKFCRLVVNTTSLNMHPATEKHERRKEKFWHITRGRNQSRRSLWCFVRGGMDVTDSKWGFIFWWRAMRGGHEWLIFPPRQHSFVSSFFFFVNCVQNEVSAPFPCCFERRGDEPEHMGGLQARKTRGVEMATCPDDGCPVISAPRPVTLVQSQSRGTCW